MHDIWLDDFQLPKYGYIEEILVMEDGEILIIVMHHHNCMTTVIEVIGREYRKNETEIENNRFN